MIGAIVFFVSLVVTLMFGYAVVMCWIHSGKPTRDQLPACITMHVVLAAGIVGLVLTARPWSF